MCPIYDYEDLRTGKKITILRTIDEHDKLPTEEEAVKEGMTADEFTKAQFEKKIGNFMLVRGRNWSGSKGNW